MNPYEVCPVFEIESFMLRLVAEEDAEDLLTCYADTKAQKFFNCDKCTGDFCMYRKEDIQQCIKAWLWAYSQQEYVRFSVIDKSLSKAVGTVEMFGYIGKYKTKTGILRVDVASAYEKEQYLIEIFRLCNENFFDLFEVDTISTKAIPEAIERRNALVKINFYQSSSYEREHYFLSSRSC